MNMKNSEVNASNPDQTVPDVANPVPDAPLTIHAQEGSAERVEQVRRESVAGVRSLARVRWRWWALAGGTRHRGSGLVALLRGAGILLAGLLFALLVYGVLALTCVRKLDAEMAAAAVRANAEVKRVLAQLEQEAPEDAAQLARVELRHERHGMGSALVARVWLPEDPSKKGVSAFPPHEEEMVKLHPMRYPIYKVESRLSAEALLRILHSAGEAARGDGEFPGEKINAQYVEMMRHAEDGGASLQATLSKISKGALFDWTRRLSGVVQACMMGLFGCFLAALWVRCHVDFGFDSKLRDCPELAGCFQLPVDLVDHVHAVEAFHKFDAAIRELKSCSEFKGYFIDAISLHMYREAAVALCQTGHHKLEAVRQFLEACARGFVGRFYSSMSLCRWLLWSLPTAGFVGTTIGIGAALGNATRLQSPNVAEREVGRSLVSGEISVAFDSTFTGLLLSMVGMWLIHLVQERQENHAHEAAAEVNEALTRAALFGTPGTVQHTPVILYSRAGELAPPLSPARPVRRFPMLLWRAILLLVLGVISVILMNRDKISPWLEQVRQLVAGL